MQILAITRTGSEYMYNARTAHKVSKAGAGKIRDILNENNFMLNPGEKWHEYTIDEYSKAYCFANQYSFTIRKDTVKRLRKAYIF